MAEKIYYLVRVKGEKGIRGAKSLAEIPEPVYRNLLRARDTRDELVASKGKGRHYVVTMDDVIVYKNKKDIPQSILDIPHNSVDADAAEKEAELNDEISALRAELAKERAKKAGGTAPAKSKTKKELDEEAAAALLEDNITNVDPNAKGLED